MMLVKRFRRHHGGRSNAATAGADTFPWQLLPVELQMLVLAVVDPGAIPALIQSSKSVAEQVLQLAAQKWPGRVELRVQARHGKDWAATRRLLQWAPPVCLKLTLLSPYPSQMVHYTLKLQRASCAALKGLFTTGTATLQPLLSVTEVHIEGLLLPWVTPISLADSCPKAHTLCLSGCRILLDRSSSCCKHRTIRASTVPAVSIRRLKVSNTVVSGLHQLMSAADKGSKRAYALVNQLRGSLPNLSRLDVSDAIHNPRLVSLWGPQLTELVVNFPASVPTATLVSQLKTLVMPNYIVCSPGHLRNLLTLPQVDHLEVNGFKDITEDFTRQSCLWRHLKLHIQGFMKLYVVDLANVPLHSLTTPLELGSGQCRLQVVLPNNVDPQRLANLQQMTTQLLHCGVKVQANEVSYEPHTQWPIPVDDHHPAELLSAVSPLFHAAKRVRIFQYMAGDQLISALSIAHRGLKKLALELHAVEQAGNNLWTALLAGLPELGELEAHGCLRVVTEYEYEAYMEVLCSNLATAMSQRPIGRRLQLSFPDRHYSISPHTLSVKLKSIQQRHTQIAFHARHDGLEGRRRLILLVERSSQGLLQLVAAGPSTCLPSRTTLWGMFHACTGNLHDYVRRLLF